MPAYTAQIPLLQNRLPLFRFFCAQLGAADGFKTLRGWLKDVRLGYGDDSHSFFHDVLAGQAELRLPPDTLAPYDLRIKGYVERLNTGRSPRVQLLYFQWLAALFSEWFLDRYCSGAEALRAALNRWLNDNLNLAQGVHFDPDDLTKVAFWMATGSGKTLLLHINLWQAQCYAARAGRRFDNVLLVTPNEGLSRQHLEEHAKSGIPVRTRRRWLGFKPKWTAPRWRNTGSRAAGKLSRPPCLRVRPPACWRRFPGAGSRRRGGSALPISLPVNATPAMAITHHFKPAWEMFRPRPLN